MKRQVVGLTFLLAHAACGKPAEVAGDSRRRDAGRMTGVDPLPDDDRARPAGGGGKDPAPPGGGGPADCTPSPERAASPGGRTTKRLTTFEWTSPATGVAECLAFYDDGSARLVVYQAQGGPIGSFVVQPAAADRAALIAVGAGPVLFDLAAPQPDPAAVALRAIAERVAAAARNKPRASAMFRVGALAEASPGKRQIALVVVGGGTHAVEFELDPPSSAVAFGQSGASVGRAALPELATGFVTPDAEGLGGLGRRATVKPKAFGVIAFDVVVPGEAETVSIEIAGWLAEALPDQRLPQRFAVRTEEFALPAASGN